MSIPGDENPNPQWQRPKEEKPQWSSGSPLGDGAEDPPPAPPQWQQQPPQSEWQRQPKPEWQQPPPPAQQYPGWVPPPRTPGQAYAALILGIVGLVLCPILPSILAVIFGHIARGEIRRSGGQLGGSGISLAGLILGWVGIGIWVLIFAAVAIAGAS